MSATERPGYHHGDLRQALLAAAEAELAEGGPENFSLRATARRAGVSHAAPKHHFGSAEGLLDAVAAAGFRRLVESMEKAMAGVAAPDRLIASGEGYVRFAQANPSMFKLMFARSRAQSPSPELGEAGGRAFAILSANAASALGMSEPGNRSNAPEAASIALAVAASWSLVHGLAHLLIEDSPAIRSLLGDEDGGAAIGRVLRQKLPVGAPAR